MHLGAATVVAGPLRFVSAQVCKKSISKMNFGLVTYLWAKDWDLPTLISNCEKTGVLGVELRTTHAHGVEPHLNTQQRKEVKKRFDNSPAVLVGLGSDERFDNPDPTRLKKAIEATKAFIKLSHDVGGSGVKVKPDSFHKGVPREKTIEQIGNSLNTVGAFAADYGQQIRLEVHGQCAELPTIKAIMDIANHPNVGVCWNCNEEDLAGNGLEYNFNLVKHRFGDTLHIRELNIGKYPYQQLMNLLVEMDYAGWILLEARTNPKDRAKALIEQRQIWENMITKAQHTAASVHQTFGTSGVKITELAEKLRVEINGKLFTEYYFKNVPRPYFYPVIGPTGDNITRHWPMKEGQNEEHDHRHHRSLWFTHGDVNGHDFWSEQKGFGKIVHDKFLKVTSGPDVGVIQSQNKWMTNSGEIICTDTRTHKFYNRPESQFMDFDVTLHASHGEITLGDTKEGSMAIRLTPTMRLKGKVGQGHIVNNNGTRDSATWGKRAAWCDYYGPVKGRIVGVAIFDHPQNPKHPTWWHVRDYGLFTANPFGVHYFEKKPRGTGNITIPSGQSLTFRYRFYFHKGDEKQANVEEHYRKYAAE
jgi:sugar phosphate isomerase/epimerase